jgi:hypothetical protein
LDSPCYPFIRCAFGFKNIQSISSIQSCESIKKSPSTPNNFILQKFANHYRDSAKVHSCIRKYLFAIWNFLMYYKLLSLMNETFSLLSQQPLLDNMTLKTLDHSEIHFSFYSVF